MMKIFILFILFVSDVYANAPYKVKDSLEVRLPLSLQGFNKLNGTSFDNVKKRRDYYLEVYGGENFMLEVAPSPLKLRLKKNSNKARLQVSTKIQESQFLCGSTKLYSSLKKSHQYEVKSADFESMSKIFTRSLATLAHPNISLINDFKQLENKLWPYLKKNKKEIESKIKAEKVFFVPIEVGQKLMRIRQVKTSRGKVEISLRKIIDYDADNRPYFSYELEIEPKDSGSWSEQDLFRFACKELELAKLSPRDMTNVRYRRRNQTLEQLRRANKFLGF